MLNSDFFRIDEKLLEIARDCENRCSLQLASADTVAEYNGTKVLSAYINNKVNAQCLNGTTGYGYGDIGRDTLDKVFAQIVEAEDALVRHNFVSGTHALSVALFGVLRTGDTLLAITGKPYDTLEEVIGISGDSGNGSLIDYGIKYDQIDLLSDGSMNLQSIRERCKGVKVAYIQRSRGYSLRPAFTISDIEKAIKVVKEVSPETIIMVDNCYGEFVEKHEPTSIGADLIVGSLIKNAGGGIAKTGGYIAGRKDLIKLCSYRLTCVGMGKEVGCSLNENREMFLGLFLAPDVVANAIKTSIFACQLLSRVGFECFPENETPRGDIITAIKLRNEENLMAFCRGIQKGSPIDSYVLPEPWDMPGYSNKVIMAAGTFTMGASIELSADAPLREPFAVWLQGGITYTSGKIGIMLAVQELIDRNRLIL